MSEKIPLIIIAGPTGVGKSFIGTEISKILNTPLISADSRQIYKHFDIGTAKPTLKEQEEVKHYMIDIAEPTERYTVAEYSDQVTPLIKEIYESGKIPLIVGGTGLYIKAIVQGFSMPQVEEQPELRKELKEKALEVGNSVLYQEAMSIDPESASKIHENDLFRVIRILEVYKTTGKKLSELRSKTEEPNYDLTYIGINCDRDELYTRIGNRVEVMIKDGLLNELKDLVENYGEDLPLLQTINYREPLEYLQGKVSIDEAKELMKKNTRNFAKRQLTWFRNDPYITWQNLESKNDKDKILEYIMSSKNLVKFIR
jgi:tRNA dimethylallyltransferase